jgi:hypothetical protein
VAVGVSERTDDITELAELVAWLTFSLSAWLQPESMSAIPTIAAEIVAARFVILPTTFPFDSTNRTAPRQLTRFFEIVYRA